jgi:hypothetical protein
VTISLETDNTSVHVDRPTCNPSVPIIDSSSATVPMSVDTCSNSTSCRSSVSASSNKCKTSTKQGKDKGFQRNNLIESDEDEAQEQSDEQQLSRKRRAGLYNSYLICLLLSTIIVQVRSINFIFQLHSDSCI